MTLIESLKSLQESKKFTKEELLAITNVEELFYEILGKTVNETPNYENLYGVFDDIHERMYETNYNVFQEYLNLKYYYLVEVYSVDLVVLTSLMEIIGPVALDYELEKRFFLEDDFYKFYLGRYDQFRRNNEFSIYKLVKSMNINDLKVEGEELNKTVRDLKKTLDIK